MNNRPDQARVEQILRTDASITVLVNNAGVGAPARLLDSNPDCLEAMIDPNVTALVRLTYAALPGFIERRSEVIINIASVLGIVPELLNGVYGGTKAFVIAFSRSLHKEFARTRPQMTRPRGRAVTEWLKASQSDAFSGESRPTSTAYVRCWCLGMLCGA